MYALQVEKKLGDALTKVPSSYICNRCKERGHYVGDCPTNEDPAYDISAGLDYVCKFCKERGTHYFLFCPRNPDPNSIYRRRQNKALQRRQADIYRDNLPFRRASPLSPDYERGSRSTRPFRADTMISRRSISPRETVSFTNRNETGSNEALEEDYAGYGGVNKMEQGMIGQNQGFSDCDMVWERLKNDIQREYARGLQTQLTNSANSTVLDQPFLQPVVATTIDQTPNSVFLRKLFTNHPSQPNPRWKKRVNALDMWNTDEENNCHAEDEENAGNIEQDFSL